MNTSTKNPEFVKRMVVDSENLKVIRDKFFRGETLSESEIEEVLRTRPTHSEFTWGNDRLSMLPWSGLEHLHKCLVETVKNNVPGDFIETGAWRGGACMLAKAVYDDLGSSKKIYIADSFEGLPPPNVDKYEYDKGDTHYLDKNMVSSYEKVIENFKRFGLMDERVIFLKGWFKDTLPNAPIGKISILRMDGDMYESTMDALENLYPKLSIGGYCVIDDFYHKSCRMAIRNFRAANGITETIMKVDKDPRNEIHFWVKEREIGPLNKNYPVSGLRKILINVKDAFLYTSRKALYKLRSR
jgi:O-methyltransferase